MPRLSATAFRRLSGLEEARRKWDHVHALVEQVSTFAAAGSEMVLMQQIGRAATDVGRVLDDCGYGALADSAAGLKMQMRRTNLTQMKIRTMRDTVAEVRSALDQAVRQLRADQLRQPGVEQRETDRPPHRT
jgi:hypothetical protein